LGLHFTRLKHYFKANFEGIPPEVFKAIIVYVWMFTLFAKMNAYLRKIVKDLGIEINP
jgi:hypothetical protein